MSSSSLSRNYDKALKLLQRATAMPAKRAAYHDKSEPVQNRLFRSLRVWSMYADLEESLGTFEVGHVHNYGYSNNNYYYDS